MERWSGKVAVVTGASAGIGVAVVKDLLAAGLIVVGLARRVDKIEALRSSLDTSMAHRLHAIHCDVSDLASIRRAFEQIERQFSVVNILINNAGALKNTMILTADNEADLRSVVDTNLVGLINCTKSAYQLMANREVFGHIVNVNSILGHSTHHLGTCPMVNVYPATKYGITATTEILRQELNYLKNDRVKVSVRESSISPGMVKTDIISASGFRNDDLIYGRNPYLMPEDVSNAILYILGTPPNVQVHELILKPVGERA